MAYIIFKLQNEHGLIVSDCVLDVTVLFFKLELKGLKRCNVLFQYSNVHVIMSKLFSPNVFKCPA